ncbi:protein kinase domain-containing protein [Streptomyces chattanoogensis]|uniref:protein kinase domain-containing protein n=1 Tax=Streptomyces chattanoogensis TaxID=66876 RepID=UPI0036C4DECD
MEAGASTGFLAGPHPGGVRRLGNRYELGELLGRGGTAEVHAAHDLRLDRGVAVKTLRSDLAGDASAAARFRREALSAASLNHPSIVAVYDTGEDLVGGVHVPYIVMERVDGSTFADLLHGGGRLPPTRALELTAGVLEALAHAHRSGVVHSDIKPANVMLSHDGVVKVTDFGTARRVDVQGAPLTQHTAVIGTPRYLSPEQAQGKAVGAPADLYSTGCLLYELLTARPPFLGDGVVSLILQHVEAQPAPPSSLVRGLPPGCDPLVLRALNKAPGDRHPDAEEMRRDIERVLAGLPSGAAASYAGPGRPASVVLTPRAPAVSLHTEPTLVFPAPGPSAVAPEQDAEEPEGWAGAGRPARHRIRGAVYLIGALMAVSAGLYAIAAPDAARPAAGEPDAGRPTAPAPQRPGSTAVQTPTRVPDLIGRTLAQARTLAKNAGLRLVPSGRAHKGRHCRGPVEAGTVCDASPEPGTDVAPGSEIRVRVRAPSGARRPLAFSPVHRINHRRNDHS